MSYSITKKLNFIDSFQFLSSSLDGSAENSAKDEFQYLSQGFDNNISHLVKQEGFYPYEYMNDFKNFKEKLPSKEKFHSSLTNRKNTKKKVEHVLYPTCHCVFLTFIAMGRGQILSPTLFS